MRPKAILGFELISLSTLAIGGVQTWVESQHADPSTFGVMVAIQLVRWLIVGGLTLLVSRRRSRIAMWLLILFFASHLVFLYLGGLHIVLAGSVWLTALGTVGTAVALGLLFTPAAREWMRNRPDGRELHATFS